jgi:aryl-alcohol dehydrogenase-like predicted oxidoreductase
MQFSGKGIISAFFSPLAQTQIDTVIKAAVDGGITWFDTAEMYGGGNAERSLSTGLTHAGIKSGDVTVATKWAPLARVANNIERTIGERLSALDPFPVDLHQIHLGFGSFSSIGKQVQAMGRLVERATIRAIGVNNFSARQMEIAHATLAEYGIPLASNQIQLNLLHRKIETNGVLETARRLGVTLIAYSPLREGILTGRFHGDRRSVAALPRLRRMTGFSAKQLDRTAPLIEEMRGIAAAHSATISQVALGG